MKAKLITTSVFSAILAMSAVFAYMPNAEAHEGFRRYHGHGGGMGWVAPALIGGVIGYELSRPHPVYVEPAPVYVTPPPVVYTPPPVTVVKPGYSGYHQETILDANCNCYRTVLVPNRYEN
jgi:hypothetical protein